MRLVNDGVARGYSVLARMRARNRVLQCEGRANRLFKFAPATIHVDFEFSWLRANARPWSVHSFVRPKRRRRHFIPLSNSVAA